MNLALMKTMGNNRLSNLTKKRISLLIVKMLSYDQMKKEIMNEPKI